MLMCGSMSYMGGVDLQLNTVWVQADGITAAILAPMDKGKPIEETRSLVGITAGTNSRMEIYSVARANWTW